MHSSLIASEWKPEASCGYCNRLISWAFTFICNRHDLQLKTNKAVDFETVLKRRPLVQVLGPFRSGTNATKACLERFYKVEVVYNRWFWKHGLPPASQDHPLPPAVSVLMLSRHPVHWALSMHRFWRQRRPELNVPESFSEFLREPFVVYDNTGDSVRPRYWFSGPIDYWNRYYYSWLSWGDLKPQLHCIRLEDLTADANGCLAPIAESAGWRRQGQERLELPRHRVGPQVSPPRPDELELVSADDRLWIEAMLSQSLMLQLGYSDASSADEGRAGQV